MTGLKSYFSIDVKEKRGTHQTTCSLWVLPVLKNRALLFRRCSISSLATLICLIALMATAHAEPLNRAPDCSQATVTPNRLWPVNYKMVPLQIQGVTDPENQSITIETQCIIQDEPVGAWRWYRRRYDGEGLTTSTPAVRAWRKRAFMSWKDWRIVRSGGRIYDIIFKATDSEGAACSGKVSVEVPLRKKQTVKDSGYRFSSLPGGVNCQAEPINNQPVIVSEPVTDARVNTPYQYTVAGHDPDQESLHYTLAAKPDGMTIDPQEGVIQWTPTVEHVGVHPLIVEVMDAGGLQASQSFNLTVEPALDEFSAEIIANPVTGSSPLNVRFRPSVNNNNIVISKYAWDLNGDGETDRTDSFGAPQSYTYTGNPGDSFEATLTVTPSGGEPFITTQTITLANQPPTAQVSASVSNGHAPLVVTFTVNGQDPNGIETITIDYEGDGTADETVTVDAVTSGSWSFQTTYGNEGVFVAIVKITDTSGAETVITNNAISVDVNNPLDPVIQLSATPQSGNTPLTITITATAKIFDNSSISLWSWDLDGDGNFETQGGSGMTDTVSHTYNGVDNYYPVVRVTTNSNRTAQASLRVTTSSSAKPQLTIADSSDTINSDAKESAAINIHLPFETQVEVWIESADGTRITTVQPPQITSAGDHVLSWDGTDEFGSVVSEGDYYAILGYTALGIQHKVDLRDSTGGALSYSRRADANPSSFDRLKQPLRVDYTVDNPAAVTFFWQVSFGARLMTLMEHKPMGRGQYSLFWNGEYPNGQKLPSSVVNLIPGILRYSLADNVIFIKENPRIENYTLASTIIADPRRESIGIDLTLSKTSSVELVVSDMERGIDVATRVYPDIDAGDYRLIWDGKNNDDQYLAPGDYRLGVRSVDSRGNRSLFWYRTQRIDY